MAFAGRLTGFRGASLALALMVGTTTSSGPDLALAQTTASNGPASVADLAEGLLDAVVNISTSQGVKEETDGPRPKIEDGSPFQDYFKDFFKEGSEPDSSRSQKVNSLGSGFVIDPAGYVVTNNHVIEGADSIEVIFADGSKLKAKLIGTDTKTDLSLLKVESKKPLKFVKFGDSRKMRIGDWVMAIGNPFGLGGTVTVGIISARGRNINAGPYDNFIQTDAAINKGNSGGPLFNMYGEVIGINTAIISPSGGSIGIGFSVPTEIAENVVNQLREFGETRRGWLGVRIQPVPDSIAKTLGMDVPHGAFVAGVIEGGPVDNGSIKTGDIITSFDGNKINEMRDLPRAVAESPVGKDVDVVLLRDGKEMTVKVTLGRLETPEKAEDANAGDDQDSLEPESPDTDQPMPDQPQDVPMTPDALLGMTLAPLDEEQRKAFDISEEVEGVVVTDVVGGSPAAEKGIVRGNVIVEVSQTFVESPEDVGAKIAELKDGDRRIVHLMVSNAKGELRFVSIRLD